MSRSWRRLAIWIGVPVLLLATFWLSWLFLARRAFEERVAELRKRGEAVHPAQLAGPAVPRAENAAPLLRRAAAIIGLRPGVGWDPATWTAEERAEAMRWVMRARAALPLLRAAAKKPKCDFEPDWSKAPETILESISVVPPIAHLLLTRAALDIEPVESIRLLLRCSDYMERGYLLPAMLSASFSEAALEAVQAEAKKPGFDAAAACRELAPLFFRAGRIDLARVLRGHRADGLAVIVRILDGGTEWYDMVATFGGTGLPDRLLVAVTHSELGRPHWYADAGRFVVLMNEAITRAERGQDLGPVVARAAGMSPAYQLTHGTGPLLKKAQENVRKNAATCRLAVKGLEALQRGDVERVSEDGIVWILKEKR